MPVTPKMKFNDNEKLLCYHGPLLYEAKCVKTKKEGNSYSYYVHYQGWNKNWDEWVSESRMLKINPESREMQKRLLEQHLAATKESKKSKSSKQGSKRTSSRASTPVKSNDPLPPPTSSSSKKKRGTAETEESSSPFLSSTTTPRIASTKFKICIPEELRYVLANDWDLIVCQRNLFVLPAKYTVSGLIRDYIEEKKNASTSSLSAISACKNVNVIAEVLNGIKDLFNKLLGRHFLYKVEYKQYEELAGDRSYCNIYGSPHLLRLLSRIDGLLNLTRIVEIDLDVTLIEAVICDFLKYLEDNMAKLFTSKNYKDAGEEYLKNL